MFTVIISRELSLGWFYFLEGAGLIFLNNLLVLLLFLTIVVSIIFTFEENKGKLIFILNTGSMVWQDISVLSLIHNLQPLHHWSQFCSQAFLLLSSHCFTKKTQSHVMFSCLFSLPHHFHDHILIFWFHLLALW